MKKNTPVLMIALLIQNVTLKAFQGSFKENSIKKCNTVTPLNAPGNNNDQSFESLLRKPNYSYNKEQLALLPFLSIIISFSSSSSFSSGNTVSKNCRDTGTKNKPHYGKLSSKGRLNKQKSTIQFYEKGGNSSHYQRRIGKKST